MPLLLSRIPTFFKNILTTLYPLIRSGIMGVTNMKNLILISLITCSLTSAFAQSGTIRVKKVKHDERYFMREDTARQTIWLWGQCGGAICADKPPFNDLGIMGGIEGDNSGLSYRIGVSLSSITRKATSGVYYRSLFDGTQKSIHAFYQRSISRVQHGLHMHKIWSVGLDAGIELGETGVPSIEPYIGYSLPTTCFLNRFQANLGYRFQLNPVNEASNTRNSVEIALWFYL